MINIPALQAVVARIISLQQTRESIEPRIARTDMYTPQAIALFKHQLKSTNLSLELHKTTLRNML